VGGGEFSNSDNRKELELVAEHADEIERLIAQLKADGSYDATLSDEDESAVVGELLERAEELNDADVELLMASVEEAPMAEVQELEREVAYVVVRAAEARLSPLARRRVEKGFTIDQLVAAAAVRLRLGLNARSKFHRYYQALEAGVLGVDSVSTRLYEVLAELLGVSRPVFVMADQLLVEGLIAQRDEPVVRLQRDAAAAIEPLPNPDDPEWDEVDELFRGAPCSAE
jgi:hypothetical protein